MSLLPQQGNGQAAFTLSDDNSFIILINNHCCHNSLAGRRTVTAAFVNISLQDGPCLTLSISMGGKILFYAFRFFLWSFLPYVMIILSGF